MTEQRLKFTPRQLTWLLSLLVIGLTPGCVYKGAIPVRHLPPQFRCDCKEGEVPIDFSLLRQEQPDEHLIDYKDVLGIRVKNILENGDNPAIVLPPSEYQPTVGAGRPYSVRKDGTINLPMVGDIQLRGKTIPEANEVIRSAYLDAGLLPAGTEDVEVRLLQERKVKVHVIRQDTESAVPLALRVDQQVHSKRGTSATVELSIYENDILHALDLTGGLPGTDAKNELWVIRGNGLRRGESQQLIQQISGNKDFAGSDPNKLGSQVTRIPLRLSANDTYELPEEDIILNDGDIVYIGSRDTEFFITGGLLDGGQIPLPRDYDVDALTALAMANGNAMGPAAGAQSNNFQTGPGNIIPPSRLIVIRQIEGGDQIKILVNLKRAVDDENERINIMPGDLLILEYTNLELFTNVMLNLINLNHNID